VQKLSITLLGATSFGIRIPSAGAGALAVLATYLCIAFLEDRRTALMGAALVAASSYHIHWSALALNNIWGTLWVPLMLGGYAWAWKGGSRLGMLVCALALGLAQYFYAGSRVGAVLLAFLAVGLWRTDRDPDRMARQLGAVLIPATVIAAPVLIFALTNPDHLLARMEQDLYWNGLAQGYGLGSVDVNLSAVLDQLGRSLAGFTTLPDQTGFFGSQVPLTFGLAAPLLAAGVIWACYRRAFLPVLWLGLTVMFGGFLLQATPSRSHYVVAIPAIAWLIAMPLSAIAETGRPSLAWLLLAVIMSTDLVYYFGVYLPGGASPHLLAPFPTPPR
jgi:4-amino-4-deoxy-L-arabinose transferase-like glycosyltransferase